MGPLGDADGGRLRKDIGVGRKGFPGRQETTVRNFPIIVRETNTGGALLSLSVGDQSELTGVSRNGIPLMCFFSLGSEDAKYVFKVSASDSASFS